MSDDPQANSTDKNEDIEREIRMNRTFSLSEAIGQMAGGGFMKGGSPMSPKRICLPPHLAVQPTRTIRHRQPSTRFSRLPVVPIPITFRCLFLLVTFNRDAGSRTTSVIHRVPRASA